MLELPNGYKEYKRINLQKNKKLALFVNTLSIVIAALLALLAFRLRPVSLSIFDIFGKAPKTGALLLRSLALLAAIIAYILCHELTHGVFIRIFSGRRAKYGFTGLYAYAGSDAYFGKRQYLVISLSPAVLFGVLLLLLNIFLPRHFWFVYILQIINLSGAAGDFYVTYLLFRAPADMLSRDEGIEMVFYSRGD
jgi:hypothetical protein